MDIFKKNNTGCRDTCALRCYENLNCSKRVGGKEIKPEGPGGQCDLRRKGKVKSDAQGFHFVGLSGQ